MQAFSIEKALTSGFGLLRREWKAALAWGALYIAAIIAIELMMFGPAFISMFAPGGKSLEGAETVLQRSLTHGGWPLIALGYLLIIAVAVVLYGAIARAQLRPEERGRFYIRFSKQELWMGLSMVVLGIVAILFIGVIAVAFMFAIRMLTGSDADSNVLLSVALGIPAAIGGLYVMMRFSLSWLMAWDESRFVLFESWRLTKGQGWRLVLLYLALIFMITIASLGVVLLLIVVGAVAGLIAKALGAAGIVLAIIGVPVLIACYVAMLSAYLVVAISPFIEAYRGLRDAEPAPEPVAASNP